MGIVLNYRSALPTGQLSDTAAGGPDNVTVVVACF